MSVLLRAALGLMLISLAAPEASAQSYQSLRRGGNFGLGVGAGTYGGGLSAKYWLSDIAAVQGTIAGGGYISDGEGNLRLTVNADYLFEQPPLFEAEGLEIAWNIGPGAGLQIESENGIGIGLSGVAGLEFALTVIPVELVFEYRPYMQFGDEYFRLEFISFGGQLRYFFG